MTFDSTWTVTAQTNSRPYGWAAAAVAVLALGGLIVGFVGLAAGVSTADASSTPDGTIRFGAIVTLLLMSLLVAAVMFVAVRVSRRGTLRFWLVTAFVGYLLTLWSWVGAAMGVRLLFSSGESPGLLAIAVGWVVDLALWMLLAWSATVMARRQVQAAPHLGSLR